MYLNVTEVESALRGLAAAYPDICTLVELPHKTNEGRTVFALHIGRRDLQKISGVYLTGGVHAREWGTVDICINFAADLLEAYSRDTGLKYHAVAFNALDVKTIVEGLDVIVHACANPDGRAHDMGSGPAEDEGRSWRKNRRQNAGTNYVGVDLNRNQDIIWNSDLHLHPTAAARASDSYPSGDYYRGPSAASEPETRNIAWILDAFPSIGFYMDIHCFTGTILYPWGHSPNQSNNPGMNFRNPAWDGQRGLEHGPYGEYIDAAHETALRALALHVAKTINNVRGLVDRDQYDASQSFYLKPPRKDEDPNVPNTYPTTGANDDYAYSRHLVDSRKPAVLGFTMEFNRKPSFYPSWSEMESQHIPDVCAGLLAFCLNAYKLSFPRIDLPEIMGQIFGGVTAGGGGIIILPSGKVIKIPPRQERILQALEAWGAYLAALEMGPELGHALSLASLSALEKIVAAELERFG